MVGVGAQTTGVDECVVELRGVLLRVLTVLIVFEHRGLAGQCDDECRPDRRGVVFGQVRHDVAEGGEEVRGVLEVERVVDEGDVAADARPGFLDPVADLFDLLGIGVRGGDDADLLVLEGVADEFGSRRGDEVVLLVDVPARGIELRAQVVTVGAQGVDLALQGLPDRLLERTGTKDDADGQGEEHRDEGDEVVTEINHWSILG